MERDTYRLILRQVTQNYMQKSKKEYTGSFIKNFVSEVTFGQTGGDKKLNK